jgi:hypothetical protein
MTTTSNDICKVVRLTELGDYADQIRLRTLLKDDLYYRQWFCKPPTIRVVHSTPPWRLFVQKERGGRWYKKDLPTYAQAFAAVKLKLPEYWDMAIHCKPQAFKPPVIRVGKKRVWNPIPEGHVWCGYCRRPTVFRNYKRHGNMKGLTKGDLRCQICGVRESFLTQYPIAAGWPFLVAQSMP